MATIAAITWLLLLCLTVISAQETVMTWHNISDPQALCNDFTRAGYFIRRGQNAQKWVIYLESGGLCFSGTTCNRRFTQSNFRGGDLLNEVNIGDIWTTNCGSAKDANNTFSLAPDSECVMKGLLSPLMTSLWRYSPSEGDFTIEGRDFLSTDPVTNHQFSEHNHVLIPYCSSDLWLGDDNRSLSRSGEFRFDPDKTDSIQFTLRGSRILRSAIKDLINMHSLKNASEVVLVGSSAGGIGLVNHMKWIRESIVNASQTSSPPTTSVILDSAWFIDFRGSISELILSEVLKSSSQGPSELKSLLQLDSCQVNVSYSDIPCCFLPECVVTNSAFYPVADTPTLVVQSLYDVFILAVSLRNEIILNSNRGEKKNCPLQLCSQWNGRTGSANTALGGFSITYLQRASEYAGVMNVSMNEAARENPLLSFHITSCFQHVYFAPSNLVGDSSSIFGNNSDLFATGEFSTYIR